MSDFIEIDYIQAGERASGDAITIRHRQNARNSIYVVDGGYEADGQKIVEHIHRYYNNAGVIDHMVLTHPDNDHASGLVTVLQRMKVRELWMNRPWIHVAELMPLFKNYQDRRRLISRLRRAFPGVVELEELAKCKGVKIRDAFQGFHIGQFRILAPSRQAYYHHIVESDKTPVPATSRMAVRAMSIAPAKWGDENLKGESDGTSAENETSIVQRGIVCGMKILLTGDAGVQALAEALNAAGSGGGGAQSPNWFQVPHHGSRRNVSSALLDGWLGPIRSENMGPLRGRTAIVSANPNDGNHPTKAVIRAMIHRGYVVFQTMTGVLRISSPGAPDRGWAKAKALCYPKDQED